MAGEVVEDSVVAGKVVEKGVAAMVVVVWEAAKALERMAMVVEVAMVEVARAAA